MGVLYLVVAAALVVSVVFNRKKTVTALRFAGRKFLKILPQLLVFVVAVSVFLFFVPEDRIAEILEGHGLMAGSGIAAVLGAVAFMPGFIVFPLCGLLLDRGVPFMILSAFTTTLMMVGVLSFGIEKETLGWKLALARNLAALVMALLVALATGLTFGEIAL
jgi:uncharacterized membrane protein YraQ (UPF0718 family)